MLQLPQPFASSNCACAQERLARSSQRPVTSSSTSNSKVEIQTAGGQKPLATDTALQSVDQPSRYQRWWQRFTQLPLVTDFQIIFERDPAARNWLEVLCCYPGFHALTLHRLAHWLHSCRLPFFPRLISHLTRFFTGIEIHPGAVIGKGVFIDHGMGVVIGETAIIGDYTLIYQGVTLGGTGKESGKRHPTLGTHVVVGAGAKVLGNLEIGDHVRIGAGSIVLRDVPSACTVVGVPGRNICRNRSADCPLDHGKMPDAEAIAIRALMERIEQLEAQVETLKSSRSPDHA